MNTSVPLKQCSRKDKCINPLGSWLPATPEFFARNKSRRYGLADECKICHCKRSRLYNANHPEKARVRSRRYAENNPEKTRESQRRWRTKHPEIARERVRNWHAEHPEAGRAKAHRRRALEIGSSGSHTAADVNLQIASQTDKRGRLRCWWCGGVIRDDYHVDHVIPLSKGGSNGADNIVIAHPFCNKSKGTKTPQDLGRLF